MIFAPATAMTLVFSNAFKIKNRNSAGELQPRGKPRGFMLSIKRCATLADQSDLRTLIIIVNMIETSEQPDRNFIHYIARDNSLGLWSLC